MSEDFGTNPKVAPPAVQSLHQPFTALVENHAVQLMDELFQDLEVEPDTLEAAFVDPVKAPEASTSLVLAVQEALPDNLLIPYVEMDAIVDPFPDAEPLHAPIRSSEPGLGSTVLLGLAWGSLLASAGLWAFTQFHRPAMVAAPAAPVLAAAPQDVAFAETLLQSLQEMETTSSATTPVVSVPLPTSPSTVKATLPATVAPQERSPFQAITPTVGLNATTPTVGLTKAQPLTLPSKTVSPPRPSVGASPKAPPTVALAPLPNNRLPQLSSSAPLPTLPASQMPSLAPQTQPLPMGRQSKSGVTVQGILDLGDKSAMLISRNGSPQNVRLGEVVDATGWIFTRVENGQAILQRGAEMRSVGSGEQF